MKSNFYFLQNQWPELYQRAVKAEKTVITDPRTALTYARMALELAVNWMYQNDSELELPFDKNLNSLMKQREFKEQFSYKNYNEIDLIRKVGNLAIHNRPVSETDSDQIICNLYNFARRFAKSYSQDELGTIGMMDVSLIPKEGEAALTKRQLTDLQKKIDREVSEFQEELIKEQDRTRLLQEENELYRQQIEALRAQQATQKSVSLQVDEPMDPSDEAKTRRYIIDVSLREAGWDLKGANDREYKVQHMPVSTNKSGTGYVDYVLWGDDGKPLALVEAKKSMASATLGENQAQLYADSLEKMFGQRPVMFFSNGFQTHLWDDCFYKQSRPVHGFYTKHELETIIFRRTHRQDIRTHKIDTDIAGRPYQMRSIKSIAEHFSANDKSNGQLIGTNRGALLVLATGTGKTRTAIALSKLMLEANWVKRVLFLADRVSLVSQAQRNFVKFLPEHSSVNLLEEKENPDTRFVFSTYQTMMGLIDDMKKGTERFYGVGHFDLVIVDEAHRSIYRKYQAIFDYFDALFLGLTATPKNNIDKNTYSVFGLPDKSPTDAYTFIEAVNNNHLVPYRSIEVPTRFQTQGITYSELSPEEQAEFEEEILDGEEATGNERVDKNALNDWLFNTDTAIKTLTYVLKHGIKKRGGDEIGKTIIFARNQKHAQFLKDTLLELDKAQFGNDYAKVITHSIPKSEEFIRRFCDEEKERWPQIAISVDMMDTGIDAPSAVNLVFYKPVKSYAKFWQMIGRGSRLRPDLFGPGEDKTKFLIFDLCANFEFFDENPEGIETSIQRSLTETVFNLRLQLAQYLKADTFSRDEELQNYRQQLLDGLYGEIKELDRDRFDVKMKMEHVLAYGGNNRELWNHLDKKDVKTIENHLALLVKPQNGDTDLARFYDRLLFTLILKRLEAPTTGAFVDKCKLPVNKVATLSQKLLKKMSIPEVKEQEALIKQPLTEEFWHNEGIRHLEQVRTGIRQLIKYIDKTDQKYATTNFEDILDEEEVVIKDFAGDKSDDYVSPFANNVHRLEAIIRENRHHITIQRIQKGETISQAELQELEKILFNGKLKKEELENELGQPLHLASFIVALIGLSQSHVDNAFADFINKNQLTSIQISFLETIKEFLTQNGKIDPEKLYDGPTFKKFHNHGIEGVFTEQQADVIFDIIEKVNKTEQITG